MASMSRVEALSRPEPAGALARRLSRFEPSMLLWLAMIAVLVFLVASPMVRLVVSSFQEAEPGRLTLANYSEAYGNLRQLQALLNSLELGIGAALLAGVFGVPIAWAISRTDMPAKSFVRLMVFGAFITPPYLGALGRGAWNLQRLFHDGSHRRGRRHLVSLRVRIHRLGARSGVLRDGGRGEHSRRRNPAHHLPGDAAAGAAGDPRRPHHQLSGSDRAVRRPGSDRAAGPLPRGLDPAVAILRISGPGRGGGRLFDPAAADYHPDVLAAALAGRA